MCVCVNIYQNIEQDAGSYSYQLDGLVPGVYTVSLLLQKEDQVPQIITKRLIGNFILLDKPSRSANTRE